MLVKRLDKLMTYDATNCAMLFGIKVAEAKILKTGTPVAVNDISAAKMIDLGLVEEVAEETTTESEVANGDAIITQ